MDFYQEQHSYTLARNANIDTDSDEETSWVMLDQEGDVVKLPGEKVYYKVRSRIGLDIGTPKSLPNTTPFSAKSDSGIVYITNNRVIYLPARPTGAFKSFSAPILDFEDTRVVSSFFGPWSWCGIVRPTVGGGIPHDVPRLEFKLTFKDGGHDAFQSKFEVMKERLAYARTLQQETGQIIPTGEDLPKYEATLPTGGAGRPPAPGAAPGHSASSSTGVPATSDLQQAEEPAPALTAAPDAGHGFSQVTPDEPPPDYEEAQAQALGMRLEENLREAAERQ
ncbi:hypothetical protein CMQ_6020 [Grosmannia clavigera kw1407]|uniref:WW-domain-binding protein n=1 Tax=Grosmannia clavigera (strain kw1407 / UAMH 11150) TaxID=655863 RepID=F0XLF2_GROCL|nr:uncharacterized protein CMQ_6020 [Grosmannia clavigera kw1407]EFX01078.1 hypothetical protein CMQ_6020 [Grosmannia clavigera kw1407]